MRKATAEDLNQQIYDLFDRYVHSQISRRQFLDRVSKYAVAGLTAASILEFLSPDYVSAQQVLASDPRLNSEYVNYASPRGAGRMRGLLARPSSSQEALPGVVIVHENRGLNPHIEDVARRAALEGFVALAPDALTPLGGYPGSDDEGRSLQRQRDRQEMLEDFIAGSSYLKSHSGCSGQVGVVGFCFGGWVSNMMAVRLPDLGAAVPFYGGQPAKSDVAAIRAPLLLHFGELDRRVNAGWPAYEDALKEHGKQYTAYIYAGANHGFHNDTTPRYDRDAAALAWSRTVEFLKSELS